VTQVRALAHSALEFRADGNTGKLGGYAAVFDQTTDLGFFGKERLSRSAFDAVLKLKDTDVRSLWNHNPQYLLGRQSTGTLRLSVDSTGLEYEVDLPDTQYARDVRALAERGDLDGASFSFIPGEWEWDDRTETRTHTSVATLVDVAPVTFPAYSGASTEARSLDSAAILQRSQLVRARARVTLGKVN
jgi:HK97 family phage prohead protease